MWIFHALTIFLLIDVTSPAPVVQCLWGSVQGVELEGQGRTVSAYLGIPYALPPTGQLRWQKPQPHPGPAQGKVFMADTVAPACPQDIITLGVTAGTNEDCLTLDVYVPTAVTSPRPVMVFIHGGGMVYGESACYRPYKLVADGDVIVVIIQYRVGTLGFLSTGDDTLPGNYGLWDQNLALHWVKDNIGAFGGDPDVVTVLGESAGGWSTGLQVVSPYSKGLFHRAILQSGSPVTAVKLACDSRAAFKGISKALDCEVDTDERTLECLKTRSADDIVNKTSAWMTESPFENYVGARVDGSFIPRDPVDLVQDEQYVQENGIGDIDVMAGFNNKEGALIVMASQAEGSPVEGLSDVTIFNAVLDSAVKTFNNRKSDEILSAVVDFFYRGADAGTNASVSVDALVDLFGDMMFFADTIMWLRPLAAQPHQGARYLYMIDHDFDFNKHSIRGAHHGDELWLEFDMNLPKDCVLEKLNKTMEGLSEEDMKMSDLFVDIWTTFVKTGKPGGQLNNLLGADWPEFTSEVEAYLALSLTPNVQRDIMKDRIALWVKLVPQIINATQRSQGETTGGNSVKEEL